MSTTYNGWANHETWNVALWMDNEEGTYRMIREWADEAREEGTEDGAPRRILADRLEEFVKDNAPDLGASMYADMLGAALSEVDWFEIAGNVLEESA